MENNVREYPEEEAMDSDDSSSEEEYRGEIQEPFDPKEIRVTRRSMTIDLLLNRLEYDELDLYPDFQREANLWTDGAQSRLIESLLLRIPIPAFYFDARNDDKWLVIDGVQRLTALARFVMDKKLLKERYPKFGSLDLKNLEFLTDLNGSNFRGLDRPLQRRIKETNVTVYTIDRGTPANVTYNIFKRINTGGMPLSDQEIRNASNPGPATKFLAELADSDAFSKATQDKLQNSRGEDQECILRFIAFTLSSEEKLKEAEKQGFDQFLLSFPKSLEKYKKIGFDQFLLDTMARMNKMSSDDLKALRKTFEKAMSAAHNIFGKAAFRRAYGISYGGKIIKALFDVWSVNLGQLSDIDISELIKKRKYLINEFRKLLFQSRFLRAILEQSQKFGMVKFRFDAVEKLIKETLSTQNPWENIEENYPIGSTVKGEVVRIYRPGAYVELEKGLEGLIQTSELSWTRSNPHPRSFFSEGDEVEVVVLEIDHIEKNIMLGYKQTISDTWKDILEKYTIGSVVRGTIVNIIPSGAFVELEMGIDGFIHISQLQPGWTERVENVVSVGKELNLKVIKINTNTRKIELSLKAMREEQPRGERRRTAEQSRHRQHPPALGVVLKGVVDQKEKSQ